MLGPVQDNGALTQTMMLGAGSPAIDAGPPGFPCGFSGGMTIRTKNARLDSKRRATIELECPAASMTTCNGVLEVTILVKVKKAQSSKTKTVRLGRANFKIAAGKRLKVRIKLSKSNAALVKRAKKLKATANTSATDARGGTATTKTRSVTILPAKVTKKPKS